MLTKPATTASSLHRRLIRKLVPGSTHVGISLLRAVILQKLLMSRESCVKRSMLRLSCTTKWHGLRMCVTNAASEWSVSNHSQRHSIIVLRLLWVYKQNQMKLKPRKRTIYYAIPQLMCFWTEHSCFVINKEKKQVSSRCRVKHQIMWIVLLACYEWVMDGCVFVLWCWLKLARSSSWTALLIVRQWVADSPTSNGRWYWVLQLVDFTLLHSNIQLCCLAELMANCSKLTGWWNFKTSGRKRKSWQWHRNVNTISWQIPETS